jgi:hypothetical protein
MVSGNGGCLISNKKVNYQRGEKIMLSIPATKQKGGKKSLHYN